MRKQRNGKEREANLAADDGDGRKGFPESRQSSVATVVAEDRTGSLNSVDEGDQGLHGGGNWFGLG